MNCRYIKIYLALIAFFCLPILVQAQQAFTVNGIFFKKSSDERIASATVTNLKSQQIMMSDELGGFSISASKGDTLLFKKTGYTEQKQVITGPNDIVVYMQPIIVLQQVTIQGQSTKQELNSVMNDYHNKGLYFDGHPPLMAFIASPITAFYELFSADATNERHFAKFSKNELEAIEVTKRYTPQLVKQVTHLSDDDVVKFMQQYTPSYEDMRGWNDYELISHIKHYLEYYKSHKDGVELQKLY
ncbi:hypothetical protein [Mucilaginibacter sp.]